VSTEPLRVLMVSCDGAPLPELPAASPWGPFDPLPCTGLEAATEQIALQTFDGIVIGARAVDARRLLVWPALSQAVVEPATLVLTPEPPGSELAVRLMERGVQDVLPLSIEPAEDLPRALRLAIARKSLERQVRKAFATDLMTGLPNQSQLIEHLHQLLAMRERDPAPVALLVLRIEGLATVEAEAGREAANALRRKIGVRLRAGLRGGDVVASIGADAFAVLLPKIQDPQDADRVVAKLVVALHAPFPVAGRPAAVAVASGVAQFPQDGRDAAELLRRASGLAASAQAQGRAGFANRVEQGATPPAANDPTAT